MAQSGQEEEQEQRVNVPSPESFSSPASISQQHSFSLEEEEDAALEFLSFFPSLTKYQRSNSSLEYRTDDEEEVGVDTDEKLESWADLQDGVVLFEALSDIAPAVFDPTSMHLARLSGRNSDNWALKLSNLRKLVRHIHQYWRLQNKVVSIVVNLPENPPQSQSEEALLLSIAKEGNPYALLQLMELVAAAAVTCPEKSEYVRRIMDMNPDSQAVMMSILQRSLARLSTQDNHSPSFNNDQYGEEEEEQEEVQLFDDDGDYEDDEKYSSNRDRGLFGEGWGTLSNLSGSDINTAGKGEYQTTGLLFPEEHMSNLKNEMSILKSQHEMEKEDLIRASSRLQNLVDDLQERLVRRQEELIAVEEELANTQTNMKQVQSQLAQALRDQSQIADDLEIAQAKAMQLIKAEATVAAYKKKLESQGMMSHSNRDLEEQAAQYIKQIIELEAQVKALSALNKNASELQDSMTKLERERNDLKTSNQTLVAQVQDLQMQIQQAEKTRKMLADEITELRAQAEVEASFSQSSAHAHAPSPDPELLKRLQRLEAENKELRRLSVATAMANNDDSATQATTAAANATLQDEVMRLQGELAAKEVENAKIASDKDKLEAYTKRTLAKFQDKYMVALQDCKTKLKEKQDKIEALENRSQAERTAQKREERLLSSTIYELGLTIMQNRLKEQR